MFSCFYYYKTIKIYIIFICNYINFEKYFLFFAEDKNFKTYVIKSLVDITNRIKRCEFLLKKKQNSYQNLENGFHQAHDSENILDEKFPMKSLDDIKDIEQQLKHDEIFKKQIVSID